VSISESFVPSPPLIVSAVVRFATVVLIVSFPAPVLIIFIPCPSVIVSAPPNSPIVFSSLIFISSLVPERSIVKA